jgi:hypothetical protein
MELNDYPHFYLADDGKLCPMGQHCPRLPRVLYDALIHLGYDRDALVYRCRLSRVHDLNRCEVAVTIPFDPAEPWSGFIIGSDPDTGVEMMVHLTLTSPLLQHCLSRFTRFGIRRTPYDSSTLRPCPTSRAHTSMPG